MQFLSGSKRLHFQLCCGPREPGFATHVGSALRQRSCPALGHRFVALQNALVIAFSRSFLCSLILVFSICFQHAATAVRPGPTANGWQLPHGWLTRGTLHLHSSIIPDLIISLIGFLLCADRSKRTSPAAASAVACCSSRSVSSAAS